MTTEEKLARFAQDAIDNATAKADKELAEYKEAVESMYETRTGDMQNQADARLKLTLEGMLRERNRRLSKEHLEAKRNLSVTEYEIKDKLFDQVKTMIEEYRTTPAYAEDLLDMIKKAALQIGTNKLYIFLDKADEALIPTLAAKTPLPIQVTEEPLIGGILAMSQGGGLLVDLSYAQAIDYEYDNLILGGDSHEQ